MGANPHKGIKGICDILKLNAVAMQLPIGLEEDHAGVIDLITMKANYFDGEHGDDVRIEEIPNDMSEDAEKYRAEMLEAVSMFDDQMMEDLLEDNEIEEDHAGVIDLITMKANYFDGEHGDDVRIGEIPDDMKEDAGKYRAEMLEAVSMFDDQMMEDLLEDN